MAEIPLLEFDPDRTALIEPWRMVKQHSLPQACVMIFYASLIKILESRGILKRAFELESYGVSLSPVDVFVAKTPFGDVSLVFPGIGASFSAAILEEMIAGGCKKFVACGSCGVLKPELKRGAVVIPQTALRDEGTSFHYLPPSRTVEMSPEVVTKLESVLKKHHIPYEICKTWTTDAFYRETRGKIARRKAEGCITVEMECAAFLSVAKFRDVKFGQYLGVGDDVSGDEWDPRLISDKMPFHEKLFWLSAEAVLSL